MTLKRIILSILTFVVALEMGASLIGSLGEPQVGNQLQMYQTDLLVQASEWSGSGLPDNEVQQFRKAVFGEDAIATAVKQYQEVRQDSATGLLKLQQQLKAAPEEGSDNNNQPLTATAQTQQQLIRQIDLRLGMIQSQQGNVDKALETWQRVAAAAPRIWLSGSATSPQANRYGAGADSVIAASVLNGLWQDPPVVNDNALRVIDDKLRGWYRYRALERLYTVEGKDALVSELRETELNSAERTLMQLSFVGILPSLGGLLGTAGLIALVGQWILRGKDSILAVPEDEWSVPWDWEVVWQVVVGGFLFVGQIVLPILLQLGLAVGRSTLITPEIATTGMAHSGLLVMGWTVVGWLSPDWVLGLTSRGKALYSLIFYLLMAAGTLGVLYGSIKAYLPLPKDWFRIKLTGKWPLWGLGSYLVALPLMLAISLLNQQIWQGQGGNNPILQLVLEERDPLALGMFLFTAAIAAPVFEEILFRGFILPSLTRYLPVWGAIGVSSLIFSVAHLSFSEVLPLTVLGAILGFAYVRSRNILSSILLHSTWNSVTMIGLFLLGSGGR